MKHAVSLLLLCMLSVSCVTERIPPVRQYADVPNQETFLAGKITYDEHGRPAFDDRISSRPGKAGDRFSIIHAVNGKPMRSYDVAVVERQKADMKKPLMVVYEWTGRGFEGGVAIGEGIFPSGTYMSGQEAAAYLAIKAAPVVIGSVTGFVFGFAASIPATVEELKNVVVNTRETLIGYTVYEYDEKSRIKFIRLFPPIDSAPMLVKTEFIYADGSEKPARTEVTSFVEQKTRRVR